MKPNDKRGMNTISPPTCRPPARLFATLLPATLMLLVCLAAAGCDQRLQRPNVPANTGVANELRKAFDVATEADVVAVELVDPTGFADIRGTFRIRGTAPARQPVTVTSDRDVCAPGNQAPLDEAVIVGPDNGLKNVLIFLNTDIPDEPQWIHEETYGPLREAVIDFDQEICMFIPRVLPVRTTQTLNLMNSDPVGHNTNIQPRRGANPFNQTLAAGGSVRHAPGGESPDPFPVTCNIHPWMRAYMITRNNPYFTTSEEDGSFVLERVPAGVDLEFRVWQERPGYISNVTVNGVDETWSRGRFTVNLEPDTVTEMEVVVDASLLER